ncbi:MAG: T9SS type A sorting domain-containing protein [Bacteroidia bacterium]
MMKKITYQILIFVSIVINDSFAQNLVINPGLENYITCPGFGQFDSTFINDWWKPSYGSTDYYNSNCALIPPVSQAPHGGDAYLGIIAYNYGTEYREYATGKLSLPLAAGTQYTLQFYVSLNDGYIQAVNELGAYFSSSPPGPYPNALHIPVTPQIQNSGGVLGSTTAWMLVSGTFIATGGEQYFTIGNFNDDASTTVTTVGNTGSFGAYYFVDDVSISAEPDGISVFAKGQNSIAPNPSSGIFNLTVEPGYGKVFVCQITDLSGSVILSERFTADKNSLSKEINLSHHRNGIYFLKLRSENKLAVYKIIKL